MVNFILDKESPVPFYRQIVDMILMGISTKSILPGEKLPTIREASVNLEVNPNTIAKAYTQLRLMGVLDTQQGSGVFVSRLPHPQRSLAEKNKAIDALCSDFVGRAQLLDIGIEELIEHLHCVLTESYKSHEKREI
jgi:GntR family transcriptional regulator